MVKCVLCRPTGGQTTGLFKMAAWKVLQTQTRGSVANLLYLFGSPAVDSWAELWGVCVCARPIFEQ